MLRSDVMTYIRFELQMQGADGNWRRVTSSRNPVQHEALAEMMESYKILYPDLGWLLPAELNCQKNKLRLAKCEVTVLGEVDKKSGLVSPGTVVA